MTEDVSEIAEIDVRYTTFEEDGSVAMVVDTVDRDGEKSVKSLELTITSAEKLDVEHSSDIPDPDRCWICSEGNGFTDDMQFDRAFDTFYHKECLEETGANSLLEFETSYVLKFDNKFSDVVKSGEKFETLRVDIPVWVKEGERVLLINQDSERLGVGRIKEKKMLTSDDVVDMDFDGHSNYSSKSELVEEMSEFYNEVSEEQIYDYIKWEKNK